MEHEHVDEGTPQVAPVPSASISPVRAHLLVPEVLLLVPFEDMPAQAKRPDTAATENYPAAGIGVNLSFISQASNNQSKLRQDESDTPVSIDIAIISLDLAKDEE